MVSVKLVTVLFALFVIVYATLIIAAVCHAVECVPALTVLAAVSGLILHYLTVRVALREGAHNERCKAECDALRHAAALLDPMRFHQPADAGVRLPVGVRLR
jgi:hypothetical protein